MPSNGSKRPNKFCPALLQNDFLKPWLKFLLAATSRSWFIPYMQKAFFTWFIFKTAWGDISDGQITGSGLNSKNKFCLTVWSSYSLTPSFRMVSLKHNESVSLMTLLRVWHKQRSTGMYRLSARASKNGDSLNVSKYSTRWPFVLTKNSS